MPQRAVEDLLEREVELATFAEQAELARAGTGTLLLIEGPAGIGKTRLVEAALARAREGGIEIASARASELEHDFPFGVVRQLLEPLLASVPAGERTDLLSGAAGRGASVLGDVESGSELPPGTEATYATLHGLYWLTANLAARTTLVIGVDDAQWSDAPSLRFLAYLAKRIEGLSMSMVLARRSAEPESETELLEEIASDPRARIVKPAPLSEEAVADLVRAEFSPNSHETLCLACHRATGGNPFLLRELIRTLDEAGVDATSDKPGLVSEVAPETVARSVLRRLRRLPEGALALARAVAILGDRAESHLAAQLAELDELSAAEAADALARVDIFQTGESMEFSHPIVRAAIYSSQPPAERAGGHTRAARLLAAQNRDPERAATHLLATESSGDPWTVDVLWRAARAAVSRGAPDVGATYLERAVLEPLDVEARSDMLVELGLAEVAARPPSVGIDHLREALALTDDRLKKARISLELGRALFGILDFPAAAAVLEQAHSELGEEDRELAERLEAQLIAACATSLPTVPRAYHRLDGLLEQAEAGRLADPLLLGHVSLFASGVKEPAAEGAKLAERALAGGQLVASQDTVSLSFAACALTFADRLEAAMQVWDDALAEARRTGSLPMFAFASAFRSHVAWRLGAISIAEADARAALEVAGVREAQFALPFAVMVLVDVLIERGELEEAARAVAESGIGGPLPELLQLNFVFDSRGRLRLAQGRTREALDDFLECGRRVDGWGVRNPGSIPWRSSAALALTALGERDEARRLVLEEIELARRFEVPRELGIALRAAGLVERGNHAIELLQEAVEVLEKSPAPLEHARALTDLGAALRRGGKRRDAREPLRQGLDMARRCGATALAERAHTELLATGARPRRAVLSGVDALTASEGRVAAMAAEGLTNREIAQALFVTEKTIEWHLSQAYRKLDISSRSELPRGLSVAGQAAPS